MHVNTKTIKSTNVRVLRRGCRFASVLINCRFIWFQFLFSSSSFLLSYSVVWHEQLTLGDSQNQSLLLPLMYIGRRGLLVQITFEVTGKSRNTTCRAVSCACMEKKKKKNNHSMAFLCCLHDRNQTTETAHISPNQSRQKHQKTGSVAQIKLWCFCLCYNVTSVSA